MLLQHIDIDECADRNMSACSQVCVNSVGSYRCECEKGYFLEEDRKTCTKGERGEMSLSCLQSSLFIQSQMCAWVCMCWCVLRDGDSWEALCSACSNIQLQPPRLPRSDFLAALETASQMVLSMTELDLAPDSVGEGVGWGGRGV